MSDNRLTALDASFLEVESATVQYHPEAGPGPNDALYQFDRFLEAVGAAGGGGGGGVRA